MASEQRLHPWSPLFTIAGQLVNFALPAVLLIFTTRKGSWDLWLIFLSIPALLYALYRYFTFRYSFAPDELMIRTGLVSRNERHIRYARIHNIETLRNPLHRLLGVADVRVQTAGGSEPEARLQVLSLEAVEEMRRRVFEGRSSPANAANESAGGRATEVESVPGASPEPAALAAGTAVSAISSERELVRLTPRDCLIFGLVENRGVIVIAAVLGLIWESEFFDFDPSSRSSVFRDLWRYLQGGVWSSFAWTPSTFLRLIGVFAALVVLVRVLSIGWALVRLHGFTLVRSGDELRSRSGLLSEVRSTIPLRRIQLITISEAPLQRLFGRVAVRVETAGGDKDSSVTREWLAPVLVRERAPALVEEVLGDVLPASPAWRPVHPRAELRFLREWLWVILIILVPAVVFFRAWGLALAPPLLALAWFGARGQARGYAYALGSDLVGFRSGWLWKHTSYARYGKLQSIALQHSPFDRRWGMATVQGDTAGGGSHRITIPFLPAAEAQAALRQIEARVAATEFRW